MVADVEVWPQRRRQEELAADIEVAKRDRHEHDSHGDAEDRGPDEARAKRRRPEPDKKPRGDDRKENPRVLAVQRKHPQCDSRRHEPTPPTSGENLAEARQEQRGQERVQRGLLHKTVEEDGRGIDGEQRRSAETHARTEEPAPSQPQQHARTRAHHGLQQTHSQHITTADRVGDRQQVGIERRLVEHLGPEPLPCRDLLRPQVVRAAVADEDGGNGRTVYLEHVEQPQNQRDDAHQRDGAWPTEARRHDRTRPASVRGRCGRGRLNCRAWSPTLRRHPRPRPGTFSAEREKGD